MNPEPNTTQQNGGQKRAVLVAVIVLVVVVAAALVAYRALTSSEAAKQAPTAASYELSDQQDDYDVSAAESLACTFMDPDGQELMLADIAQGKPTVVNVWATWCPYCIAEMDDFQGFYERYGNEVQFVMLNAADSSREVVEARSYIAEKGYTFSIFYDANHEFLALYGIQGLPTTVVISGEGDTLLVQRGQVDPERMEATIAQL